MKGRAEAVLARGLTTIVIMLSWFGLLSMPLGDYDDSLLVLGSRLVESGRLPYLDFYTHYGPLGYTLFSLLLRLIGGAGVALRTGQGFLLLVLGVLLHWVVRRSETNPESDEGAVPIAVLVLSGAAAFPSFLAFAAATAVPLLFAVALQSETRAALLTSSIVGGIALAVATLIRPSFALYVAAAVLLSGVLLISLKSKDGSKIAVALGSLLAASFLAGGLLWLLLYRNIPPSTAFEAALVVPLRLHSGGTRYLEPPFLSHSPFEAVAVCLTLVGANSLWIFCLSPGRPKTLAILGVGVMALLPLLLRFGFPGKPLPFLGLLYLPVAFLLCFSHRKVLSRDPTIAAAAVMGLAAASYAHYFWTRADAPHLLPWFGLATCSAALVWGKLRDFGRIGAMALFAVAYEVTAHSWHDTILPAARLRTAEFRFDTSGIHLGCQKFPESAAKAVALADRKASRGSRFVAVASSHTATQWNPVLLFAASDRLPYTRWFQYDPGLQSSAPIQKEMERELLASRSQTGVVWRADRFLVDWPPDQSRPLLRRVRPALEPRTELDSFFDRLYPRTIARFGDYEVRERDPSKGHP